MALPETNLTIQAAYPKKVIEAVARALWDENYPPPVHPGDMVHHRIAAIALLDRIMPMLVLETNAEPK